MSRVAPMKSAPALKMELSDCSSPKSRNAMITDRMVRMVRVFLRNRFATTKPVLVMRTSGRQLLEQLPLLQVQRAPRELGSLRIVRDHHDCLAVLAIQHLQQSEDLVGRLTVEIAGGLIA